MALRLLPLLTPLLPQASELPHLAPRALQQVVSLVAKGMNLPPVNGKSAPPKKAVLVASHSQPTSLVCSAGGGAPQVLVANQKAASGVAVRAAPGQPSCSNKPVSFVMSSGAQGNQVGTPPGGGSPCLCSMVGFFKGCYATRCESD